MKFIKRINKKKVPADFDAETYLRLNPDVKNAGVKRRASLRYLRF